MSARDSAVHHDSAEATKGAERLFAEMMSGWSAKLPEVSVDLARSRA